MTAPRLVPRIYPCEVHDNSYVITDADASMLEEVVDVARGTLQALAQEHGAKDREPECYLCDAESDLRAALAKLDAGRGK